MRKNNRVMIVIVLLSFLAACQSNKPKAKMDIIEQAVVYRAGNTEMQGYVYYDQSSDKKRPAVLVVPEWWGLNAYTKMRARQLAALGYIAMAVDIYGNAKTASNPTDAGKLATPFYQDPTLAKAHFDAAREHLIKYKECDVNKVAAIGYCFGGGLLLNIVRMGEDLQGIASFHGSLVGTPFNKDLLKTNILVLHGADDKFVSVEDVQEFKTKMDSIGADYKFISYAGATHAFTNPAATALGKKFQLPIAYNAAADTASWNEMRAFLNTIFK